MTGNAEPIDRECFAFEASFLTDVGCSRSENEDRIRYFKPSDGGVHLEKGSLAIIADGMGGHQGGEVASQLAVDTISKAYFGQREEDPLEILKTSFAQANTAIYETAAGKPELRGMGTTCTALLVRNGQAGFAHVGDTRLYLLREGIFGLLTTDHTVVMDLVKAGVLSPEDARRHPNRFLVTRALGIAPEVVVDTSEGFFPVRAGDVYLLCSDGLHDLAEDEEIARAIKLYTPNTAAEYLIGLAKERGGYDNISVGILVAREADNTAKRSPVTREQHIGAL